MPRYLAAHKIPFSPDVLEEMLDLAPKYMAQMFGTMLGSYAIANPENQDPTLEELIQQYSTGV